MVTSAQVNTKTPLFSCEDMVLFVRMVGLYAVSCYEEDLPDEFAALQGDRLAADFLNATVPGIDISPYE